MRHNGVLGRQHWQACYSVPFIDIQDIFIPRKLWYSSPRCVIITISREYDKRSKFSPFQENCWSYRTCFLLFSETFFFSIRCSRTSFASCVLHAPCNWSFNCIVFLLKLQLTVLQSSFFFSIRRRFIGPLDPEI